MTLTKKSLGEIIAISLFIVVATVSIIGFQTFYTDYQSKNTAKIENRTYDLDKKIQIEEIIGDTLYITNTVGNNTSFNQIKVGNKTCKLNTTLSYGMNQVDIGRCLVNIENKNQEINLISNYSVNSKNIYVNDLDGANSFAKKIGENTAGYYITESINHEYLIGGITPLGPECCGGYGCSTCASGWALKYNLNGTIMFNSTFNNTGISSGFVTSIEEDSEKNIYVLWVSDSLQNDVKVSKLNSNGTLIWNKTYILSTTGIYGVDIKKTLNENYFLILGRTQDTHSLLLIKIDDDGEQIWNKSYYIFQAAPGNILPLSNGKIALLGLKASGSYNILITNSSGDVELAKNFSTPDGSTNLGNILQSTENEFYLTGIFNSSRNLWIIKMNSTLSPIWNKSIPSPSTYYTYSSIINNNNEVVVLSSTMIGNLTLMKFDSNGNLNYNKTLENTSNSKGYKLISTNDGSYVITGTNSNEDYESLWLLKLNSRLNACYYEDYDGEC